MARSGVSKDGGENRRRKESGSGSEPRDELQPQKRSIIMMTFSDRTTKVKLPKWQMLCKRLNGLISCLSWQKYLSDIDSWWSTGTRLFSQVQNRKKRSSYSGCFLLRANDKFSDNRHVLIDVSMPVSQNHQWISSGERRREPQCLCEVLWFSSHLIHPVIKAVNAQLTPGTVQPAPSSCRVVGGARSPISTLLPLESSAVWNASYLIAQGPPSVTLHSED